MRSAAAPTATVLMIFTLVFAPVLKHNRFVDMLVGKQETKVEVPCAPAKPCPRVVSVVDKVKAPDASKASVDAAIARSVEKAIADLLAGRSAGTSFGSR